MAGAGGDKDKRLRGSGAAADRAKRNQRDSKSRLQKLVKAVGNDEISRRLTQGNTTREMMLAHLVERLHLIRQVQLREIQATRRGAHWPWWRMVADSHKKGWDKPEPTRWHQSAFLYEKAAQVICSGDLRQGKSWMERAIAEEDKQWTKVSSNVIDTNSLEFDNHGTFEAVYVQSLVDEAPATGACDLPPDLSVADEIMRVEQTVDDPMNRRRRRDPWWTLDEEEEEEEGNDGGGG